MVILLRLLTCLKGSNRQKLFSHIWCILWPLSSWASSYFPKMSFFALNLPFFCLFCLFLVIVVRKKWLLGPNLVRKKRLLGPKLAGKNGYPSKSSQEKMVTRSKPCQEKMVTRSKPRQEKMVTQTWSKSCQEKTVTQTTLWTNIFLDHKILIFIDK